MSNYDNGFSDSLLDEFLVQPGTESFFPGESAEEWMSHAERYTDINREIDEFMYCDTADDIQLSPLSSDSGNHSPTASSTSGSESQPFFDNAWYMTEEPHQQQPQPHVSHTPQNTFTLSQFSLSATPQVTEFSRQLLPDDLQLHFRFLNSLARLKKVKVTTLTFQQVTIQQPQQVQDVQVLYLVPVESPPAQNTIPPTPVKPLPIIRPKTELDIGSVAQNAPTPAPFVYTTPISFATLPPTASAPTIEIPVKRQDTIDSGYDDFAKKKEDRKLRNREAAQLSRQRKREEVERMQKRLKVVEDENRRLLDTNDKLKKRITVLENENNILRSNLQNQGFFRSSTTGGNRQKAGAVLFVFALIVTFHGVPFFRQVDISPEQELADASNLDHPGRSLPLISASVDGDINGESYRNSSIPSLDECRNGTKAMNQTEAIRLNDDLSRWVSRHDLLDDYKIHLSKNPLKKIYKKEEKVEKKSSLSTIVNKTDERREAQNNARYRERAWKHLNLLSSYEKAVKNYTGTNKAKNDTKTAERRPEVNSPPVKNYELQLPSDTERKYRQLVAALQQRSDTLYLVAMKDYFLLPPTNRNSTSRPRMSLVLPALSMNGETHQGQVTMMRIECEVMGTGLFDIPGSLLPLFFNQTNHP
uniref:BZIP domain-containing protein n=1 Tax=Steinernema glaseri TaxID=37863 RepID=A0A1I7YMV9_9BILA